MRPDFGQIWVVSLSFFACKRRARVSAATRQTRDCSVFSLDAVDAQNAAMATTSGIEMHWAINAPENWSLERPPEMSDFNGDRVQWDTARNTWYARATKKILPAIKDSVARERDWVRALNARHKRLKRKRNDATALTPVPVPVVPASALASTRLHRLSQQVPHLASLPLHSWQQGRV